MRPTLSGLQFLLKSGSGERKGGRILTQLIIAIKFFKLPTFFNSNPVHLIYTSSKVFHRQSAFPCDSSQFSAYWIWARKRNLVHGIASQIMVQPRRTVDTYRYTVVQYVAILCVQDGLVCPRVTDQMSNLCWLGVLDVSKLSALVWCSMESTRAVKPAIGWVTY